MTSDLEAVTKAAQTASLLCDDLRAIYRSDNPLLSHIAIGEIEAFSAIQIRLERLREGFESMEAKQ